jgi:ADP-ribose pyrophosphatase YjhB (NUDIX family)
MTLVTHSRDADYEGAIVVVEETPGRLVLIHPGGDLDGPASLPGNPCRPGEAPEVGAVRIVRELTGLEVEVATEIDHFVQEGTPTGTMCAHGFVAKVVGGNRLPAGAEGPVSVHPVSDLPPMVPIRIAIRRVLDTYLHNR